MLADLAIVVVIWSVFALAMTALWIASVWTIRQVRILRVRFYLWRDMRKEAKRDRAFDRGWAREQRNWRKTW